MLYNRRTFKSIESIDKIVMAFSINWNTADNKQHLNYTYMDGMGRSNQGAGQNNNIAITIEISYNYGAFKR